MKLTIPALVMLALFTAPVSHAEPKGPAYGYWKNREGRRLDPAIPEPSASLVFGVGLLTVAAAARRRDSAR